MAIIELNKQYLCNLLRERKEWLQNEVKRLMLDKASSSVMIEQYIGEMENIYTQRKALGK
jgi:predicted DNA-binding protein